MAMLTSADDGGGEGQGHAAGTQDESGGEIIDAQGQAGDDELAGTLCVGVGAAEVLTERPAQPVAADGDQQACADLPGGVPQTSSRARPSAERATSCGVEDMWSYFGDPLDRPWRR